MQAKCSFFRITPGRRGTDTEAGFDSLTINGVEYSGKLTRSGDEEDQGDYEDMDPYGGSSGGSYNYGYSPGLAPGDQYGGISVDFPDPLVPDREITWRSDGSEHRSGWLICQESSTRPHAPPFPPFTTVDRAPCNAPRKKLRRCQAACKYQQSAHAARARWKVEWRGRTRTGNRRETSRTYCLQYSILFGS